MFNVLSATYGPNMVRCPPAVWESLQMYAYSRIPPGGFLRAVLSNDLIDAVARADADNLLALPAICGAVHNGLPRACWGSREAVAAWLAGSGTET